MGTNVATLASGFAVGAMEWSPQATYRRRADMPKVSNESGFPIAGDRGALNLPTAGKQTFPTSPMNQDLSHPTT